MKTGVKIFYDTQRGDLESWVSMNPQLQIVSTHSHPILNTRESKSHPAYMVDDMLIVLYTYIES